MPYKLKKDSELRGELYVEAFDAKEIDKKVIMSVSATNLKYFKFFNKKGSVAF